MDKIRIKNLRSINDSGYIELKSINIAVGCNSSGKSTFLRTFPLLRQSTEKKTRGPILWSGNTIDFDSFETAVNSTDDNGKEKNIEFLFVLNINNSDRFNVSQDKEQIKIECNVCISKNKVGRGCHTSKYSVNLYGHEIEFIFDEDGTIISCKSEKLTWELKKNDLKYQVTNTDSLLPIFHVDRYLFLNKEQDEKNITSIVFKQLLTIFKGISGSKSDDKTHRLVRNFLSKYRSAEERMHLLKLTRSTSKWKNHFRNEHVPDFDFISGLADLHFVMERSYYVNQEITRVLNGVRYFAPLRTTAQRYYRYQDLSVDEIDSKGDNLGMFLSNINRNKKKQLDEWTKEHFGFVINHDYSGGHVSIFIQNSTTGLQNNIADVGFGYSQVLPIIVQLWSISSGYENSLSRAKRDSYIYVIEQPELHLHPKMQAMIASVFGASISLAKKNDINLKFIIETHSTSIISKLGELTCSGEIEKDSISILLFEEGNGERIRFSKFDDQGFLTDWPIGFLEY